MLLSRNVRLLASGLWFLAACGEPERGADAGSEAEDAAVEEAGELDAAQQDDAGGGALDAEVEAAVLDDATPDAAVRERPDAASDGAVEPDAGNRGDSGARDPGSSGDGDSTLKTYPVQPELTDKGAQKGRSFHFSMDSTKSTIFDGKDATLNPQKPRLLTRNIDVYVPARYRDGTPAPILVIQDGPGPIDLVSRALDNLTTSSDPARRLPAFIAIAVQNGGNDAQGSERGLEYDTLSDRYARFIQLEVLPAVLANAQIKAAYPNLKFTDDPEGKATYGCSSGGAAAFTMAWFRPDLFRRAITYSGTFVAQQNGGQPESSLYPLGAWEYHSSKKLIANASANKPVRAFLNVNSDDLGASDAESTHHNWVLANRRMAAELKTKGYHYRFVYAEGKNHCNADVLKASLADTLIWTWAGYPSE